ncbi:hypothetical protein BKA93DRAFT_789659 [Sparassis latifolia]|uniref:Arrestin-like N-terminal domain-containing protein n=1 Tax=Sparassis crispa TaxID=139825 RepID=A0A401GSV1_9APHY|nr:hypothetical protein SCP_0704820 [Sparassis crispa]GBE85295.1 hypothetical protein SCP_0704820 [Sparassis crispa]
MSTTSLPSYIPPTFGRSPSYTAEPQAHEQRLALNGVRQRPSGDFIKYSRSGGFSLRLIEQPGGVILPVYGCGEAVEGTVELVKPESVASVEVKIEGTLRLKEIAEGGTTTRNLCVSSASWTKDTFEGSFPPSVPFSLTLPATFSDGRDEYPLPPTHEAHLSGVPGFRAAIDYMVSVTVQKDKSLLRLGNSTISTPFVYYPRSRPAVPLPTMFVMRQNPGDTSLVQVTEWQCYESVLTSKTQGGKDITAKLYVPALRVYCMAQSIPFHLIFASSAFSLAAFLPLGPTTALPADKQPTRIQILRQTTVDVRNTTVLGTKTDIWRVQAIGEGIFRHAGDGPNWIAYNGDIGLSPEVKIGGFKAGGFSIKDFLVLGVTPPDPSKAPFGELRQVVPIRLTTDPWDVSTGYPEPIILPEEACPEFQFPG